MYAMEGADVAIVYLPEEEVDAQETKRLIEKEGRTCICIPKDVSTHTLALLFSTRVACFKY